MEVRFTLSRVMFFFAFLAAVSLTAPVFAKSAGAPATAADKQRYIVILQDPPLATYDGRAMHTPERDMDMMRFPATANRFTGAGKLNVNTQASKKYLKFLDERFEVFRGESTLRLGRQLKPIHRYRSAVNGFATELSEAEVRALLDTPGVRAVVRDKVHKPDTDSGPNWLGADTIHDGSAGSFPASGGEGTVIGIIDSGVNWDHPSFADPGEGPLPGWDHVNPYVTQLGRCSKPSVLCNDKLVGVYDFAGPGVGEEDTDGKDNSGHGSHVASIAAGNPVNVVLSGIPAVIAGVAPNANIVSYRVCFIGDPVDPDDDGCPDSAIIAAIEQAIEDQVDVVNFSVGSEPENPWHSGSSTLAFLNLRAAGIFVATSAGNAGPDAGTIGSPANAPWITAVGNASHDRVFASALESLSGGDTPPPNDLIGAGSSDGIGVRRIVHAKDYGSALCGTGASEPVSVIPPACSDYTNYSGASNPFAPGTFNGEIVVCDRGTYGRVEKGKNLQLAGAGGYILANTESWGESIETDDHCLPATHLGFYDSEELRTWLGSGSNHQGALSEVFIGHFDEAGDRIASRSSRGPGLPPVQDVLKPDVIAPGTLILGAYIGDPGFAIVNGTSMSSPHVTGGAALLKSVHPDWTPSMISSALVMTATPELAKDFDDSQVTVHDRGAGRPQLDQAANAGLYLLETEQNFLDANPELDGDPKSLNLPGLVDSGCAKTCAFKRTVTDMAGGATWSATVEGFADGVSVNVSPANFTLAPGASQELTINLDLGPMVGVWLYGEVRLSSDGLPDAVFPVAVLPDWKIESNQVSGWQDFEHGDLSAMPDATFTSGGLVAPTMTVMNLPQDPTDDFPYDGGAGVQTVWHTVPADTLWLHAETLSSTSIDIDLYVGRDTNGDRIAQASEELCSSTTPSDIESCDLYTPDAGDYWILVQNWDAGTALDQVNLKSAVLSNSTASPMSITGSGIIADGETKKVRLSWDNVSALPGTELLGAVGFGTNRETPNNLGIFPVTFVKTDVAEPETLVLMNGVDRGLTIAAGGTHDRMFFDIPPGTDSFTVSTSSNNGQNQALQLELYRVDFGNAFTNAPFVAAADTSGGPMASASGSVNAGPTVTVTGSNAIPGRWFAVLVNTGNVAADVQARADISFSGTPFPLRQGLWQASSRPDLSQGYDYSSSGGYRAFLWYTYDDDGNPAWYLASGPEPAGNIWVAELLRFSNDGTLQQSTPVGHVSITLLAEDDSIFSFVLFGKDGSDRERPSLPPVCPVIDGSQRSYYGLWSRTADGVGGSTVVVNEVSQAFVHYIYDGSGRPVWLIGAPNPQSATEPEAVLLQFSGFCAVCAEQAVTTEDVGVFTRDLTSESSMTWNLNYVLNSPLSGSVDRSDNTIKLTEPVACQ